MSVGPGDGHAHGSGNPHYWLDPKNAEVITATILEALTRIDPANAAAYEANRAAFLARLQAKLAEWEAKLAPLRAMPIVAYHNSWPYFARRFRLDFVGFIEVKPGVPPSPAHLAGIVRTMRARNVRIVVREPHEPQRDVAFVAGKAGATVVTLAASVGALPQAGDYIALFDANVAALLAAAAMIEAIAFLWPPFLVAVCLVGIHAYFGIQVLARKVIFVDLALAQIAALGATAAFMLGHPAQSAATYGYSLAFTLLAAVLLAFTRAWATRVPQEALIGVIYVVAAAAAILLIDRAPQGAEHLKQILTGNILTSGLNDVAVIVPLYLAIGLLHWLWRRRLTGAGSLAWDFVFYATFGVVVTSSVAIAGVLLVFSFLIIPAAIGVMFARHARPPARDRLDRRHRSPARRRSPPPSRSICRPAPRWSARSASALAVAGMLYPFLRGDRRKRAARRDRKPRADRRRDSRRLRAAVGGRAARRPAADRSRRIRGAAAALALFHRRRAGDLRGCRRLRGTLPARGGAAERAGKAQPHRRRGVRRFQRGADFLVPQILRRNAQGRAVRHGRGARAGARARALEREPRIAVARAAVGAGSVARVGAALGLASRAGVAVAMLSRLVLRAEHGKECEARLPKRLRRTLIAHVAIEVASKSYDRGIVGARLFGDRDGAREDGAACRSSLHKMQAPGFGSVHQPRAIDKVEQRLLGQRVLDDGAGEKREQASRGLRQSECRVVGDDRDVACDDKA